MALGVEQERAWMSWMLKQMHDHEQLQMVARITDNESLDRINPLELLVIMHLLQHAACPGSFLFKIKGRTLIPGARHPQPTTDPCFYAESWV